MNVYSSNNNNKITPCYHKLKKLKIKNIRLKNYKANANQPNIRHVPPTGVRRRTLVSPVMA